MKPSSTIEQQFIEGYDAYADAIFRHCALRLGNREVGKDLMQDTFMKAWEYIASGHEIDNLRAFLYKIANNLIVDTVRRNKRRREDSLEALQEQGIDFQTGGPTAQDDFSMHQVLHVLQKVDEPYRTAVIMRHINGLPVKEMASIEDISENAMSVRINRGIQKLRSLIDNGT